MPPRQDGSPEADVLVGQKQAAASDCPQSAQLARLAMDPFRQQSSFNSPALKPILLLAGGALAVTTAASIWIYIQGTSELRAQAKAQSLYLYMEGANSTGGAANPADTHPADTAPKSKPAR